LICLLLALQWGGATYAWDDRRIIALWIVCAILTAAFLITQTTLIGGKARTFPRGLAQNRDIWLAAIYSMAITGVMYVMILYLPLWFQIVRGDSALSAGTMVTPSIAGYVACSVIAGAVTAIIGYYTPAMLLGIALAISGSALLTTVNPNSSTAQLVGYQLLYGSGVGFGFGQPSYVVQTVLPAQDVSIGVTFITLVQNLSASIFVAVAQSVFQAQLPGRLHTIVPDLDISSILRSSTEELISTIPPQDKEKALAAFSASLVVTLYISLALSCLSAVGALGIRWGSMKKGVTSSPSG
jgi:hypothetical protein